MPSLSHIATFCKRIDWREAFKTTVRLLTPGYSYKKKMAYWVLFSIRVSFAFSTTLYSPIFHASVRLGWKYYGFQIGRFKDTKANGFRIDC